MYPKGPLWLHFAERNKPGPTLILIDTKMKEWYNINMTTVYETAELTAAIGCTWQEGDAAQYEITVPHGLLRTVHDRTNNYNLQWLESSAPRQGLGRQLLFEGLSHAQRLGAEHISATIMSKECLEDMKVVFGEDCIAVFHEGYYKDDPRVAELDPKLRLAELDLDL